MKTIIVTGGCGFIGSNFIRMMLQRYPDYRIINLDKLTYAGNLENLRDLDHDPRYRFVRGDIADREAVASCFSEPVWALINFAAETHVDRSISGATGGFITTDVYGAFVLLEAARDHDVKRFIQISTDEVYGSIEQGSFVETDRLQPNSPYSASKASGELLARSFAVTWGLPVIITRCSNNFGPHQYPEKLIPLFITNAIDDIPLPLYGDGLNVRDWIYVLDHCEAIDFLLHHGAAGEIYNIGGSNERTNVEITQLILAALHKDRTLIKPVKDRPGHDRRYAVNCDKLRALGWAPRCDFRQGMQDTIEWYQSHQDWWRPLKNKREEFVEFYRKHYGLSMQSRKEAP